MPYKGRLNNGIIRRFRRPFLLWFKLEIYPLGHTVFLHFAKFPP
ncbi:hypothetical protein NEIFLAOT_00914 [Neisseria flavescens NRL30031/H210]|uniref:Uncharacterized protein n=1 Tax=Neisseria flavescens NRL30031/H210 TaxID=546264 RepID=C0ELV2_NEIFL|nr:hypothetical protein NEIFLAOT_00914 [Neisseria flavescens NRL30031/H210]